MVAAISISPAAAFAATALLDSEKADVRRFCGYPTYGSGISGFVGYRFFQAYGVLEYRMNNLAPAEFQNVRYRLSLLYPIETALSGMYALLQVDHAGPFKRNANEQADRTRHYNSERRALCQSLGIPPGPELGDGLVRMVI